MTGLKELSQELAALVQRGAEHVVRIEERRGAPATGVVWSADGVLVAASHSIDEDGGVEVGLPGGGTATAEVVGRDLTTDLVVLRAAASGLAAPAFAEPEPLEPGELVVALSRPGRSVRAELGLLARAAGEWRAPAGGRLERYLELSLPLRPGFSGSLVLAADGRPLGLATAGLLRGVALAVPAPALRRVVKAILAHGRVRRGYLGLATFPVRLAPPAAEQAGQEGALLVSAVEPDGPAHRAGVLLGDALLELAGQRVESPHDLAPVLEGERIGDAVAVKVLRAGEPRQLVLTIGARERDGRRP
ncbi:MAG TPA: S1C family serine protease [Anaeromyxobacteraceae bacterium]|nr:S1C family serine protease [Anaeromyxobacteraceae bacterium]